MPHACLVATSGGGGERLPAGYGIGIDTSIIGAYPKPLATGWPITFACIIIDSFSSPALCLRYAHRSVTTSACMIASHRRRSRLALGQEASEASGTHACMPQETCLSFHLPSMLRSIRSFPGNERIEHACMHGRSSRLFFFLFFFGNNS